MDDYYEYRHVILPREVYKKMPRGRLLIENVHFILLSNGEPWESSNHEDGYTTNCTGHNPIFFSSGEPKALTHKLACLQQDLSLHPTLLLIDLNYALINYLLTFILNFPSCP